MKRTIVILLLASFALQGSFAQKFYRQERLRFSNRTDWEIAPVPYMNGIVYISNRTSASAIDYSDQNKLDFSNIYYIEQKGENEWDTPKLLSPKFTTNYHDGPVAFAQDDELICIVRSYVSETGGSGRQSNPNSGLYFSSNIDGEWTDPEPFPYNDESFVLYSPFLTPEGDVLYFAGNLQDTRGGFDIYVSRMEDGNWTEPENLGNEINTAEDEVFPYLHSSGRLYFSSKGHDAVGGSDIFYSNNLAGVWSRAIKLPPPINSGADDYTLIMSDDFSEGYYTSKRIGGTPDIYRFYTSFPSFDVPRAIQRNRFCFRLRENSLDTIDYTIFDYEWVINDTLKIPGHDIKYCFPGPGEYDLNFNVTNKVTDTIMYGVASLFLQLELIEQPVISSVDTAYVNQEVIFSSMETYLPTFEIDGYYWDFGDGMKSTGIEVSNIYGFPGKYRVVLGVLEKVKNRRFDPEKFSVYKDIIVLPEE